MLEAGRDVAVPLPVASAVHQMFVLAKAQGLVTARLAQGPVAGSGTDSSERP